MLTYTIIFLVIITLIIGWYVYTLHKFYIAKIKVIHEFSEYGLSPDLAHEIFNETIEIIKPMVAYNYSAKEIADMIITTLDAIIPNHGITFDPKKSKCIEETISLCLYVRDTLKSVALPKLLENEEHITDLIGDRILGFVTGYCKRAIKAYSVSGHDDVKKTVVYMMVFNSIYAEEGLRSLDKAKIKISEHNEHFIIGMKDGEDAFMNLLNQYKII